MGRLGALLLAGGFGYQWLRKDRQSKIGGRCQRQGPSSASLKHFGNIRWIDLLGFPGHLDWTEARTASQLIRQLA